MCACALYFYNYASDVSFQKDQLLTEVDGGFHYQNEACSIQMNNKIKIISICLPPICNISFCLEQYEDDGQNDLYFLIDKWLYIHWMVMNKEFCVSWCESIIS